MNDDDLQRAAQTLTAAKLLPIESTFRYIKNTEGLNLIFEFVGAVNLRSVTYLLLHSRTEGYLIVPISDLPEALATALDVLAPAPAAEAVAA